MTSKLKKQIIADFEAFKEQRENDDHYVGGFCRLDISEFVRLNARSYGVNCTEVLDIVLDNCELPSYTKGN